MSYSSPGNIRELQNVIERAVILSQSSVLELDSDVIPVLTPAVASNLDDQSNIVESILPPAVLTSTTLEEIERGHIVTVLNQTKGVVEGPRGAAKILGLHPNTLRHRMQKLGLKRSAYRET
jgi:formate hydrogenlyase transcriptional activator